MVAGGDEGKTPPSDAAPTPTPPSPPGSVNPGEHASKAADVLAQVEKVRRRLLSEAAELQASAEYKQVERLANEAVTRAKEEVDTFLKEPMVSEARDKVTSMVSDVDVDAVAEQARVKVNKMLAEAASLAELQAQSAETLSLLAKEKVSKSLKGPQEDLVRWQADVVCSVEARVMREFTGIVSELEPSLRERGRQVSTSALGFLGPRSKTPAHALLEHAKKQAASENDPEGRERLERFERLVVKPVLTPFKQGMMEPVWERMPLFLGGLVVYGVACGALGAWLGGRKCRGGGDGGNRGGSRSTG